MKLQTRNKLIEIAKDKISNKDPSHDFDHALRVLANAETIAKAENANLNILIFSALFHDLITYQKNHPQRHNSQKLSADLAEKILRDFEEFLNKESANLSNFNWLSSTYVIFTREEYKKHCAELRDQNDSYETRPYSWEYYRREAKKIQGEYDALMTAHKDKVSTMRIRIIALSILLVINGIAKLVSIYS